jgi:basic membrane lipoprotein Med (substrate-binding protein (PBP1-ABC) superfamily)
MFVPPTYDFAHPFFENHAFVGMAEDRRYAHPKWGFIDTMGKQIVEFKYSQVKDFSEGLAAVKTQDGKWGFIDYKDNMVIPNIYDDIYSFKNGLAWATIKSDKKYGFINKKGEWVITFDEPAQVFDIRWSKRVK